MHLIWLLLFFAFNVLITISDFTQRRVPNPLILAAIVLQVGWLIGFYLKILPPPLGASSIFNLASSFAVALLIFFPLWRFKIFGAGDVKYIATLGLLLGYPDALMLVLFGSLLVGAYALAIRFLGTIPLFMAFSQKQYQRRAPYAGCIALACLIWIFWRIDQGI